MIARLTKDYSAIKVTLPSCPPVKFIYVDSYNHRTHYPRENPGIHELVIRPADITHSTVSDDCCITYTIIAEQFCRTDFKGLFIITVAYEDGGNHSTIVFDEELFYCLRVTLFERICVPCVDNKQFHKLELLFMRETMFRESVALNRVDDALKYYGEVLRLRPDCGQCFIDRPLSNRPVSCVICLDRTQP